MKAIVFLIIVNLLTSMKAQNTEIITVIGVFKEVKP